MTPAKSEADSAVLRAKPDNEVASMILIACSSCYPARPIELVTR
jgi:hypothetical protein